MTPEWMVYGRALVALVFVIGLIFLFAALAKKMKFADRLIGQKKRPPQLEIMETLYLDSKHRLVTVRSGGKEHVLLLGTTGNLLIESRARDESHVV